MAKEWQNALTQLTADNRTWRALRHESDCVRLSKIVVRLMRLNGDPERAPRAKANYLDYSHGVVVHAGKDHRFNSYFIGKERGMYTVQLFSRESAKNARGWVTVFSRNPVEHGVYRTRHPLSECLQFLYVHNACGVAA